MIIGWMIIINLSIKKWFRIRDLGSVSLSWVLSVYIPSKFPKQGVVTENAQYMFVEWIIAWFLVHEILLGKISVLWQEVVSY